MAAKKKPAQRGVMDIAKPGKGTLSPSGTTRPTIIKHPHMPDPMVNNDPKPDLPPPAASLKPAKKVVIKPIHDTVTPDPVGTAPDVPEAMKVVDVEPAPKPEAASKITVATEPTSEEPVKVESSKASADAPAAETEKPVTAEDDLTNVTLADVAGDIDVGVPAESEQREDDAKIARARAARLQKMIDEEEYFLPIQTLEERRSRRVAILGLLLIIVLAVAWYNVALDAGLLPNSFSVPHTSFFSIK
jgi:hypothetical protein